MVTIIKTKWRFSVGETLSVDSIFDGVGVVGWLYDHHGGFEIVGEVGGRVALPDIITMLFLALFDGESPFLAIDKTEKNFGLRLKYADASQGGEEVDQKEATVWYGIHFRGFCVLVEVVGVEISSHTSSRNSS